MKRFVIWDTHFGHKRIIEFTGRNYQSVEDMDNGIIANWNSKVGAEDEVYVIGDFSFYNAKKTADIVSQLNGKIMLVKGNHDYDRCRKARIEWTRDYYELNHDGRMVVMCHFPFEEWNKKRNGSIHLHGHLHSSPQNAVSVNGTRCDVGFDAWEGVVDLDWLVGTYLASTEDAVAAWSGNDYHGGRSRND